MIRSGRRRGWEGREGRKRDHIITRGHYDYYLPALNVIGKLHAPTPNCNCVSTSSCQLDVVPEFSVGWKERNSTICLVFGGGEIKRRGKDKGGGEWGKEGGGEGNSQRRRDCLRGGLDSRVGVRFSTETPSNSIDLLFINVRYVVYEYTGLIPNLLAAMCSAHMGEAGRGGGRRELGIAFITQWN